MASDKNTVSSVDETKPASASAASEELNPKTTQYEFLGPLGAFGFVTALPMLVLFFAICCDKTGYPSTLLISDYKTYFDQLFSGDLLKAMYDPMAMLVYLAFVALQAVLYVALPGDLYPGTLLRNGQRLKYRMNGKCGMGRLDGCLTPCLLSNLTGFTAYHSTLFIGLYFLKDTGLKPLVFVYDHWIGLAFASVMFSYAVALFVYIKSFAPGALLALGGNTGNALYDVSIPESDVVAMLITYMSDVYIT